ncbi:hypothetical protein G7K_1804-t1 [Saitoella complicata NRRL Y-17804]|uniref:Uncharacterized protein n=1 Tax=Saitoella complicata (strain BCRC 22490 / CBS 7301 / JCM 7358 / NBRC 10748 / NRRL Y-17804) TaxID=698492 RepID=A0A0E9NCN9_SAICN|nr:hypothetical protein G7K_1804-t1 [Saitoella complicata NRRL Y-17804]
MHARSLDVLNPSTSRQSSRDFQLGFSATYHLQKVTAEECCIYDTVMKDLRQRSRHPYKRHELIDIRQRKSVYTGFTSGIVL